MHRDMVEWKLGLRSLASTSKVRRRYGSIADSNIDSSHRRIRSLPGSRIADSTTPNARTLEEIGYRVGRIEQDQDSLDGQ